MTPDEFEQMRAEARESNPASLRDVHNGHQAPRASRIHLDRERREQEEEAMSAAPLGICRTQKDAWHWIADRFISATECPNLKRALVQVVQRMPDADLERLEQEHLHILHGDASTPERHRIAAPHDGGTQAGSARPVQGVDFWVLVLRPEIEDQPYAALVGEVAHEFGHILSGSVGEDAEFDACTWAMRAGFKAEVLAFLQSRMDDVPLAASSAERLARYDALAASARRRVSPDDEGQAGASPEAQRERRGRQLVNAGGTLILWGGTAWMITVLLRHIETMSAGRALFGLQAFHMADYVLAAVLVSGFSLLLAGVGVRWARRVNANAAGMLGTGFGMVLAGAMGFLIRLYWPGRSAADWAASGQADPWWDHGLIGVMGLGMMCLGGAAGYLLWSSATDHEQESK